jgi:uncharacterized protein (DUF433 family)
VPLVLTFLTERAEVSVENVLGRGVYTIPQAARLVGLTTGRVREWFKGRNTASNRQAVFHSDYKPIGDFFAISFFDLVDVYVAGQLREFGVSLKTVRGTYDRLKRELNTPHPFCRQELFTDGAEVFVRGRDRSGEEEIYEVVTKQKVFPEIILPFLRQIDYDRVTILASRWRIAQGVTVDPRICFGSPVVDEEGIPTYLLSAEYHANNKDADRVATWYRVRPETVLAAVSFENKLAA